MCIVCGAHCMQYWVGLNELLSAGGSSIDFMELLDCCLKHGARVTAQVLLLLLLWAIDKS